MMIRAKIWFAGLGLTLVACNTAKKDCEHAKKAFIDMRQREFGKSLPNVSKEQQVKLKADFESSMAKGNPVFNERCEALDKEMLACIARWDELQAIAEERGRKLDACGERPSTGSCIDEVFATKSDPCLPKIEAFLESLYK